MLPISSAELAQIQADASALLDKSCTIQRKTRTADGLGSFTETWPDVTVVRCGMAQPTAGQLASYGLLIGSLSAWQVKLPVGTDVRQLDHLLIDGQTLEAQAVLEPRSYQALLVVLASEIK